VPDFEIDLDTTEGLVFEDVEPGVYDAFISDFHAPDDEIVREGPKARYVTPIFEIVGDPEFEGQWLFRNYTVEGEGVGFFTDFWRAATGEELPVGPDEGLQTTLDLSEVIGKEVSIVVEEEEYPEGSGETRSAITEVIPKK